MSDCIKRVVAKSNGTLTERDAKDLLDTVDRAVKRKVREGFDYDDSVKEVLVKRVDNIRINLEKEKLNTQRNIIKLHSLDNKLAQFSEAGIDIKDSLRAELEGINSPIQGVRDSMQVAKRRVESAYMSRFLGELERKGLTKVFRSKALDEEVGRELWAKSAGQTVTKSKQAKQIADLIFDNLDKQRQRLNKAGADIAEIEGGIMPQRHDPFAMNKVKEDAWVEFMLLRVDEKRSFGGDYDDLSVALRGAYKALVTGIRLNDPIQANPKLFQFSGPGNLAKQVSQARQIHFKDFQSWNEWNVKFGSKSMNEGVIDSMNYNSNNIALMERYGTNPEAMLKAASDNLKRANRSKAAAEGETGIDSKLEQMIEHAMGKHMLSADIRKSRLGSNIRALNNVTMLGGATLSSLTDIPFKSLEYKFQGKSWLGSMVQPFLDMGQFFKSKKDVTEFSSYMGVYAESQIGDIGGGRFSAEDSFTDGAAKAQRLFFKLNFLAPWTDRHKFAMSRVMAMHLGGMKGKSFSDLDADTTRLFGNYNISEADWNTMRKTVKKFDDGREYLFAEDIKDEAVREKLIGYFIERRDDGVLTPGAREDRITNFGTQRGTPIGEFVRLVMQFKSFPVTAITKVWGKSLYGKGKADIPAMMYTAMMSGVFGYLATTAKDLAKGKTPKDPNMAATWWAAFAQGGGAGIAGDLLLSESGYGRGATQILAGPTLGRFDELHQLYSLAVRGKDAGAKAAKIGVSLIPGNNLFYARAALDHIMLYQMQEDLSPGYLRRMRKRMKKNFNQEFY